MDKVTIIGGGIGGLSLAVGLKRQGIEFEVYEATDEYKEAGAGIIWQINTMQALDRLGLAEAVQDQGASLSKYSIRDADDEVLIEIDWDGEFKDEFGFTTHGIYRAKHQEILVEAVGHENITMDKECVGVEQDGDAVTVMFADGTQIEREFVVGADGMRSAVRKSIFDHSLEFLDCVTHRGLPDWTPPEDLKGILWQVTTTDGHIGFVPLESDTHHGYWFFTMHDDQIQWKTPEQTKEALLELAADKPPRIQTMIEATPLDSIISVDAPYVPPMDTWTKGKVTLLGDAAHGMTPHAAQGGGMAIEDAVALSDALGEQDSPDEALEQYESVRIERANELLRRSLDNGRGAISGSREHIEELRHAPPEAISQQARQEYTLNF
jgi:2-polyprenyl-6-methoxyphenol hydroxylase-like FAD-dependent oxidoreductase